MKRYEYKLASRPHRVSDNFDIEYELNSHGVEGWQLVGIDYNCFILMREMDEPVPPLPVSAEAACGRVVGDSNVIPMLDRPRQSTVPDWRRSRVG